MGTTKTLSSRHTELAYRETDGIEVTLLWNRRSDRLTVSVLDARTGEFFELEAPRDKSLVVFHHPYSDAAHHSVTYTDELLAA